jgi:predicted DNA-binding mobile mystery protein A
MTTRNHSLILEQLDRSLQPYKTLQNASRPQKGWVRAIRDALGMSGAQLGKRLGWTRGRISRIEQDEVAGKLTMDTLRRTAEAMDCVFVYAIVPRTTLAETVEQRAHEVAERQSRRVAHTMDLEKQSLTNAELEQEIEREVDRLLQEMPRHLWDNSNGV